MKQIVRFRGALAAAGVVAMLALPSLASAGAAAAQAPNVPDSVAGAFLAIACGASINVLTFGVVHPAVIAVAVASCIAMVIDALA